MSISTLGHSKSLSNLSAFDPRLTLLSESRLELSWPPPFIMDEVVWVGEDELAGFLVASGCLNWRCLLAEWVGTVGWWGWGLLADVVEERTFLRPDVVEAGACVFIIVSVGSLTAQASDTLSSNSRNDDPLLLPPPPPLPPLPPAVEPFPLLEERFGRPGRAEMELFFQNAAVLLLEEAFSYFFEVIPTLSHGSEARRDSLITSDAREDHTTTGKWYCFFEYCCCYQQQIFKGHLGSSLAASTSTHKQHRSIIFRSITKLFFNKIKNSLLLTFLFPFSFLFFPCLLCLLPSSSFLDLPRAAARTDRQTDTQTDSPSAHLVRQCVYVYTVANNIASPAATPHGQWHKLALISMFVCVRKRELSLKCIATIQYYTWKQVHCECRYIGQTIEWPFKSNMLREW